MYKAPLRNTSIISADGTASLPEIADLIIPHLSVCYCANGNDSK